MPVFDNEEFPKPVWHNIESRKYIYPHLQLAMQYKISKRPTLKQTYKSVRTGSPRNITNKSTYFTCYLNDHIHKNRHI